MKFVRPAQPEARRAPLVRPPSLPARQEEEAPSEQLSLEEETRRQVEMEEDYAAFLRRYRQVALAVRQGKREERALEDLQLERSKWRAQLSSSSRQWVQQAEKERRRAARRKRREARERRREQAETTA